MLAIPRGRKCYFATCDRCGTSVSTDEEEFEHARHVMLNSVWMEMPRRGAGMMKWHWLCETCKPKAPTSSMPSTPIDTMQSGTVNDPKFQK